MVFASRMIICVLRGAVILSGAGDEFLTVLSESNAEGAAHMVERIEQKQEFRDVMVRLEAPCPGIAVMGGEIHMVAGSSIAEPISSTACWALSIAARTDLRFALRFS